MADDAATARVNVVDRALVKLGLPPSYSIDAETSLGGTVDLVWDGTIARAMALFDWSSMRRTSKPEPLADPPGNGWTYGFSLPGDRIGEPVAVLDQAGSRESFLREFMYEAGCVYTNVTPIWVRCRVPLDPQYWDVAFREAFATALAADLAIPLCQDSDLAELLDAKAWGGRQDGGRGGLFGALIDLSKGAEPQGRGFMNYDPLTTARFG